MKTKLLVSLFVLFFTQSAISQTIDNFTRENESILSQKLYLHTDREFYFIGDTLWFAAYLVDGSSHIPLTENSNLYLELINNEGEIVTTELFPLQQGFSQGYISFNYPELEEGNYLIRAYTDYLMQLGDDLCFHKRIKIAVTKNQVQLQNEIGQKKELENVSIDFYPEGGFLLAGMINKIAFEITGLESEEKKYNGELIDSHGKIISRFSTLYNGMGTFYFIPIRDEQYFVRLDGISKKDWKLPEIRTNGAKMAVSLQTDDYLNLSILHSEPTAESTHYLLVMHRGAGLFAYQIENEMLGKTIRLNTSQLGNGINRILLLNAHSEPISERMIFIDKKVEIPIELSLEKESFSTRSEVLLKLKAETLTDQIEQPVISVVAVNKNSLNSKGVSQNIKSYLLVDSELRGMIANATNYFENDSISSEDKLDLLMLTHGWANYIWNRQDNFINDSSYLGFGLSLKGTLYSLNKRKTLDNSEIIMGINARDQSKLFFSTTDDKGNFAFNPVYFTDTAIVFFQGRNKRDKLWSVPEVEPICQSPPIGSFYLQTLKNYPDIPFSLYRLKYFNELAMNEFNPDRNSKILEEINVKGIKLKEDDGNYRIYGQPSNSLLVTEKDYSYPNIFQYLQGRVAGVQVFRDRIIIHGFSSMIGSNDPLYLLDGITITTDVASSLSMASIEKIEVLKGNDAAIFGTRGSCGVISIFSKKGEIYVPESKKVPGTIIKKIKGFAPYREFYSPEYTDTNISSKTPDYRTTLYWKPDVQLTDGQAILSFFTCDNLSEYSIFVEGITSEGRVCIGHAEFVVDQLLSGEK